MNKVADSSSPCIISKGRDQATLQGLPDFVGEQEGSGLEQKHESDPLVVGRVGRVVSWLDTVLSDKKQKLVSFVK